jgi:hypothetical protein
MVRARRRCFDRGITLLGIRTGTRNEKRTWERSERKAAYAEFLRESDTTSAIAAEVVARLSVGLPVADLHEKSAVIVVGSLSASSTVAVLGPDEVYAAARKVLDTGTANYKAAAGHHLSESPSGVVDPKYAAASRDAREEFVIAARKALGVSK